MNGKTWQHPFYLEPDSHLKTPNLSTRILQCVSECADMGNAKHCPKYNYINCISIYIGPTINLIYYGIKNWPWMCLIYE